MRMKTWFTPARPRKAATPTPSRDATLSITHLPQEVACLPSGILSAIASHDADLAAVLLRNVLLRNLADDGSVVWLSMQTHSGELEHLASQQPELRHAVDQNRLCLLHASPQCAGLIQNLGISLLLDELAIAGSREAKLLILSHAERLFPLENIKQMRSRVRRLRAMIMKAQQPILLLFHDPDHSLIPALMAALDFFPNLATLERLQQQPVLSVWRWQAQNLLTSHWRYCLELTGQPPLLSADGTIVDLRASQLIAAKDSDRLITTLELAHSDLPSTWTVSPDLDRAMAASASNPSTPLLLAYDPAKLPALAHAIRQLRQSRPNTLNIMIWSVSDEMGSAERAVLLRAGANAVFSCPLAVPDIIALLHTQTAAIFQDTLDLDIDTLLQAATPLPLSGYLPPLAFCEAALAMLARSAPLTITHTLYRLPLRPQVAHLTVLRKLASAQPGELVTADQHHFYFFLFASSEAGARQQLQRLLVSPAAHSFGETQTWHEPEAISSELTRLETLAQTQPLPDYRTLLDQSDAAATLPATGIFHLHQNPVMTPTLAGSAIRRTPLAVHPLCAPSPALPPDLDAAQDLASPMPTEERIWFQNFDLPVHPSQGAENISSAPPAPMRQVALHPLQVHTMKPDPQNRS